MTGLLLYSIGCQATRYAVVSPVVSPNEAAPDKIVDLPPRDGINYEMSQLEDRLILRFVNRTGGPIELLGSSLLIDGRGSSHPVSTQRLAPDAAGKVVLPPRHVAQPSDAMEPAPSERPANSDSDDAIFYVGGQSLDSYKRRVRTFDWAFDQTAKVSLDWQINGKLVTHDFTFRRTKG